MTTLTEDPQQSVSLPLEPLLASVEPASPPGLFFSLHSGRPSEVVEGKEGPTWHDTIWLRRGNDDVCFFRLDRERLCWLFQRHADMAQEKKSQEKELKELESLKDGLHESRRLSEDMLERIRGEVGRLEAEIEASRPILKLLKAWALNRWPELDLKQVVPKEPRRTPLGVDCWAEEPEAGSSPDRTTRAHAGAHAGAHADLPTGAWATPQAAELVAWGEQLLAGVSDWQDGGLPADFRLADHVLVPDGRDWLRRLLESARSGLRGGPTSLLSLQRLKLLRSRRQPLPSLTPAERLAVESADERERVRKGRLRQKGERS